MERRIMDSIVEFTENVLGIKLTEYQRKLLIMAYEHKNELNEKVKISVNKVKGNDIKQTFIDYMMSGCSITDEEYQSYLEGNGVSPCSDYGMCENCPY